MGPRGLGRSRGYFVSFHSQNISLHRPPLVAVLGSACGLCRDSVRVLVALARKIKTTYSGCFYCSRVHEDSNLTDSVQRLDILFASSKIPQTAFRASGSLLKKPTTRVGFFKRCGSTRTRTSDVGFGDRNFTTKL